MKTSCFVWKAVTRHRKNLIFLGLLNANGSPSCYMPLRALSPTPLYYPLTVGRVGHRGRRGRGSGVVIGELGGVGYGGLRPSGFSGRPGQAGWTALAGFESEANSQRTEFLFRFWREKVVY